MYLFFHYKGNTCVLKNRGNKEKQERKYLSYYRQNATVNILTRLLKPIHSFIITVKGLEVERLRVSEIKRYRISGKREQQSNEKNIMKTSRQIRAY